MPGPVLDIVGIEVRWTQPIMLRAWEGVEIRLRALDPRLMVFVKQKTLLLDLCGASNPPQCVAALAWDYPSSRPSPGDLVAQSCLTLCDPMSCSMQTPGFPVLHCLLEFFQIHVH